MERIKLDEEAIINMLNELPPGWSLIGERIRKEFIFIDFIQAFSFITEVAMHSHAMDHHPKIVNVYNRVEIELWTHDLKGLSYLDFELAKRIG